MGSWRDGVSKEAQADCDRMLDVSLPFAQEMLETYGEFSPFAMTMTAETGKTQGIAIKPGQVPRPKSKAVIDNLYTRLASRAATLRAVAVVADVLLRSKTAPVDAIKVDIEHREGVAISVLVPYVKKGTGEKPDFADARAAYGERRIWPET